MLPGLEIRIRRQLIPCNDDSLVSVGIGCCNFIEISKVVVVIGINDPQDLIEPTAVIDKILLLRLLAVDMAYLD